MCSTVLCESNRDGIGGSCSSMLSKATRRGAIMLPVVFVKLLLEKACFLKELETCQEKKAKRVSAVEQENWISLKLNNENLIFLE